MMDLFSREIKGWDISDNMNADNKNALMEAVRITLGSLEGMVFHSDQVSQYCSDIVRNKLQLLGASQSMSRKGNCYDNAFVESFFFIL